MEGQDIRGLIEAYSQVYETPEVLNEDAEILSERGFPGMTQANVDAVRARSAAENQSRARIDALRQQRFGSGGSPSATGSGGTRYGTSVITANPPAKPKPTFQNSGGFGRYGAPSTQVKTPTEKPAPTKPGRTFLDGSRPSTAPARPSAAPAKPINTQKPTAPAAPTKPAPGTKAAGPESIKPKTPNPLLADKSIERMQQASQMRQKGANVTSDMISDKSVKVPAPVPQMSARAQALKAGGPAGSARERMLNQDVDIFDLVKGHLLDEGYAETEENALVIMANMSEEWRESIIMELNKSTLASYVKKASKDAADRSFDHGESEKRQYEPDEEDEKEEKKIKNRQKGISRAVDKMTKEDLDQLVEISKELATKAFATRARDAFEMDDNKQHDKADKTKERIVKKHGKKAGDEAEKAAERAIYGHNKYSEAQEREREKKKSTKKEGIELEDILALNRKMERVYEAQRARENPEDHDKEEKRKYEPVRGERTPMPPRGDKRREEFEKWYAKHVR